MKTYNFLYANIWNFDNLLLALKKARKGKNKNQAVIDFCFQQEKQLFQIEEALKNKTYRPGKYNTFTIHDPKKRMISAAPFKDRVVHHALCNIIEPIFEKTFIYDSYANQKGKGTHKAIDRYQRFARQYDYVLKCDVRKFFPSIDHQILKDQIRSKIKCIDTLWLIDLIIDNSNPQEEHLNWFEGDDLFTPLIREKGLPIGNLTSQFWGNVYLNGLDHYIKEDLSVPGYIRYVDDFVLFSKSKEALHELKSKVKDYLAALRLIPHPNKTQIHLTCRGIPFLGYQVFPHYKYVKKQSVRRYKRKLKRDLKNYFNGKTSAQDLENQLNAWSGHIRFGQSKRLEHTIFWYIRNHGVNLLKSDRGSWRVLEQ